MNSFIFPVSVSTSTGVVYGLANSYILIDVVITAGIAAVVGIATTWFCNVFFKDYVIFRLQQFKNWLKRHKKDKIEYR